MWWCSQNHLFACTYFSFIMYGITVHCFHGFASAFCSTLMKMFLLSMQMFIILIIFNTNGNLSSQKWIQLMTLSFEWKKKNAKLEKKLPLHSHIVWQLTTHFILHHNRYGIISWKNTNFQTNLCYDDRYYSYESSSFCSEWIFLINVHDHFFNNIVTIALSAFAF